MNLANNHADDFGAAGERSTERALRAAGLRWTGRPGQITIVRRQGLRIAFLGFAPYPWAARLEQVRVAQALVRKAAARADLVVVAMHAGAEGSAATHVPHGHRDVPGREPRRLASLRARRDRRRRRSRRRLGPARDPRHGAIPRPPDRLLARQLRGLQELRHRRDALAQRHPERPSARRRRVRRRDLDRRCVSTATRCRISTRPTPARASSRSSRARTSARRARASRRTA